MSNLVVFYCEKCEKKLWEKLWEKKKLALEKAIKKTHQPYLIIMFSLNTPEEKKENNFWISDTEAKNGDAIAINSMNIKW